jgi:hypothetical protein
MAEIDPDESMALARLRHEAPGEYLLHQLGDVNRDRLIRATDNGVPMESLGVTARWWQFEAYLRLLVYVQLRAQFGPDWLAPLTPEPIKRAKRAELTKYMASADDAYPLAHVDVGQLFPIIIEHWDACSHGIGLPQKVWQGKVTEIVPIRHRMAHCRRPHVDDAVRIEQLLRDLEPGANRALRAYVNWYEPRANLIDPVVEDWVVQRHPVAKRLVEHGWKNRGINFTLMAGRLPWAERRDMVTGTPGWFWIMQASLSDRQIYIDDYWSSARVQNSLPLACHIIQSSPFLIEVTLPAVGDERAISDAIGEFLEAVFETATKGDGNSIRHPWRRAEHDLDPRVDAQGLLSVLSGLNESDPITIFAAR